MLYDVLMSSLGQLAQTIFNIIGGLVSAVTPGSDKPAGLNNIWAAVAIGAFVYVAFFGGKGGGGHGKGGGGGGHH